MKYLSVFLVMIILAITGGACYAQAPAAGVALREPFTLRLKLDGNRYYEERFTRRIPYVVNNDVFMFAGESFGLKLGIVNGEVTSVAYRKHVAGADVELQFRQFVAKDGLAMMMLNIKNNLKHKLYLEASMTNPGDNNVYKTTIRPISPGQSSFESWAQPIIQLKLSHFQLKPQVSR
jgi:hypothetical protein